MCMGLDFFWFILFGVWSASWIYVYIFCQFGEFFNIISSSIFSAPSSFSSSLGISIAWMLDLSLLPQRSLRLFSFFQLYILSFDQIGQILFIVLIPFFYWAYPLSLLFQLLGYSISVFLFGYSLYPLFLCWNFQFVSKVFLISYWSTFMMAALNSLLDDSSICVISVLVSIDFLLSFPVLSTISDFLLYSGLFWYYIIR